MRSLLQRRGLRTDASAAAPAAHESHTRSLEADFEQLSVDDARRLLDLGNDLLHCILALLDEQHLLRVGMTCRQLRRAAAAPSLWHEALLAFFDGDLPPAELLQEQADPMRTLREQVLSARHLLSVEREQRGFQIPQPHFAGMREWAKALDCRVAEAQMQEGFPHARPGRPYYGCSGGAYSTTVLCYGRYVKGVVRNGGAVGRFGEAASTLTAWAVQSEGQGGEKSNNPRAGGASDFPPPRRGIMEGCDYGPLARWRDRKLADLAAASGAAVLAKQLSEQAATNTAKGLYRSSSHEDTSEGKDKAVPPPPLRLPKLLAGQYGGLFVGHTCGTSIGTIYAVDCAVDNTCINDYSAM